MKRNHPLPRNTVIFASLVCSGLLLAGAGRSEAAPQQDKGVTPQMATVELGLKGHKPMLFSVALAEDHRPSRVEVRDGRNNFRLSVNRAMKGGSKVLLRLDITWTEHDRIKSRRTERRRGRDHNSRRYRRRAHTTASFSTSSLVTVGKRAILGLLERSNGDKLLLAVTLN